MRRAAAVALASFALHGCGAPSARGEDAAVAVVELHRSAFCGRQTPQPALTVADDDAAWEAMWRRVTAGQLPRPPRPEVDFGRQLVVAVDLGRRSHGGDTLLLTAAQARVVGGVAELPVESLGSAPDAVRTTVVSSPCLLLAVERDGVTALSALGLETAPGQR